MKLVCIFEKLVRTLQKFGGLEHFERSLVEQSDTLQEFEDNPVELVGICVKLYKTTDLEKLVGTLLKLMSLKKLVGTLEKLADTLEKPADNLEKLVDTFEKLVGILVKLISTLAKLADILSKLMGT